jgi:hypothetical protein
MIIYENERRVGALSLAGLPKAIDRFGRIFLGAQKRWDQNKEKST